jgi:singapore isolate B (sub-type 7) whole genome shotgun sequence assembly, scaffold_2
VQYGGEAILADFNACCSPLISEKVREKARELLFAMVRSLAVRKNSRGEFGMTEEGDLWIYGIYAAYHALETAAKKGDLKWLKQAREWSEEDVRNRDLLLEQVESIRARGKAGERKPLDVIFQRLFVNVMLEQLYQAEYSQLIPDMVECYKQFTQQEKSRSDERPLPVLLDVVLIVLRTSSKTLRDASIQLMGDVCGEMEEEDVREIMEVFWKDEGLEESEEEKKESEEEMEMEMDESGEEEEESSEESEVEEEEESEEENSEWEEGVGFLGVILG